MMPVSLRIPSPKALGYSGLRRLRWLMGSRLVWISLILAGAGIASNLSAIEETPPTARGSKVSILREGTRIESRRIRCRVNADRLTIEFDDRHLEALPNLAAQRLLQASRDDSEDGFWIISGKLTEYQNQNYVLLEHVVRAAN